MPTYFTYCSRFGFPPSERPANFEANREPSPLRLGSMVRVHDDYYDTTREGSLGLVVQLHRNNSVKVLFFYLNHPEWSRLLRDNYYNTVDGHIYTIDPSHLTELSAEDSLMDEVRNHLNTFSERLGETIDYLYDAARSYVHSEEQGELDRRNETITEVIYRLHYRQRFYLEHQDELPSWLAGANR